MAFLDGLVLDELLLLLDEAQNALRYASHAHVVATAAPSCSPMR